MVSEAAEIGPNGGGGEEGRVRTRRRQARRFKRARAGGLGPVW